MRTARIVRETKETAITVEIDLDGAGKSDISTGIGFLDHMLEQIARHGLVDLTVRARGDLQVDAHHTAEDVGIALGDAFARALGDKRGIVRYGASCVPLDEALSRVALDCSGRPGLFYEVPFTAERLGGLESQSVREFFQGFANHAAVTLHVDNLKGANAHHQCETVFKAFGRALRQAVEPDPRAAGALPSTKGVL
ncbi:MAG: imidazoleglycerol-phosphate dehydratase HisB [Duodenibacillus sp.]|nr:imidazoleglycerol-phosphate dehydratase HisB [Duodenibacillus sp.]